MIKVRIIFMGYLKDRYLKDTFELSYEKPVKVHEVLRDAKISSIDTSIITIGGVIVPEDFLIKEAVEVKLFPFIDGG